MEHDAVTRVHFPEDQLLEHDNEIIIRQNSDHQFNVHLGFLQYKHHYEVAFQIKDNFGEDLIADPLQNLHVKVAQVMPTEDGSGHNFVVDVSAYKEKLFRETLYLHDSNNAKQRISLVICARILGKGKGTPALKNGIKCTGIDMDEDSEQSDWQGFD